MKEKPDPVLQVREFVGKLRDGAIVWVGIDSGSSGAIAFVSGGRHLVIDIPTIKVKRGGGKNKTAFVLPQIAAIFRALRVEPEEVFVCLEEAVVGIPGKGNSAYNGFRVGYNFGIWPLFLISKRYSVEVVRPSFWKKKMGLHGKDKETSRYKAMDLFPNAPLTRKKDHDRAEALLLAEYLRRTKGEHDPQDSDEELPSPRKSGRHLRSRNEHHRSKRRRKVRHR